MATLDRRPSRINARLDQGRAEKLQYLKRATHLGVSDLVKRGIDLLYEDVRRASRDPYAVLTQTGFIGAGEGPADLSTRYKEELRAVLASKHGHR